MQYMGEKYVVPHLSTSGWLTPTPCSGYDKSARTIITATRRIVHGIKTEIPELYILGNPPVSVVAFGAKEDSGINILKVGDTMSKKGWHLSALQKPAALHIAVTVRTFSRRLSLFLIRITVLQTLTIPVVDTLIADLKDVVEEVKSSKLGEDGTMVALYGLGQSSAVGPSLVGELAASFIDALYKA